MPRYARIVNAPPRFMPDAVYALQADAVTIYAWRAVYYVTPPPPFFALRCQPSYSVTLRDVCARSDAAILSAACREAARIRLLPTQYFTVLFAIDIYALTANIGAFMSARRVDARCRHTLRLITPKAADISAAHATPRSPLPAAAVMLSAGFFAISCVAMPFSFSPRFRLLLMIDAPSWVFAMPFFFLVRRLHALRPMAWDAARCCQFFCFFSAAMSAW